MLVEKFRKAEDMSMMIIFVRPTGDLGLSKENLSRFRDETISQI